MKILLDNEAYLDAVRELGRQILAKHPALENTAIIGIQQGGVILADVLVQHLREVAKSKEEFIDRIYHSDEFVVMEN
ncbi:MAG: hypothetical protein EOP04_15530 [Proteobacteria bacterium]|nr:MAG: hypothetical protein EOP04_15530 [Pseudomonadota bacterium]